MRFRIVALSVISLTVAVGRAAAAQTLKDFVAWSAMMSTPYGALPPVVTPGMAGRSPDAAANSQFELRYGHWKFEGADNGVHTGGIGARFGRVGVIVGYESCRRCEDGNIIAGVDYDAIVSSQMLTGNGASSLFTVGLRPAFGIGRSTGGAPSTTLFSGTVEVPFAVAVPVGKTVRIVPFISPGFGFGSARSGAESETGTRASLAFGAGVVDLTPGLSLNLSWRKVFLEHAPMSIGLGLTLAH